MGVLALLSAGPSARLSAQITPLDSSAALKTPPAPRLWIRPVSSLIVPGSGQLMAGQDRALIYIAAEVFLLFRYFQLNGDSEEASDSFRRLAYEVARSPFTMVPRDTVFEYYEQMQRFSESGEYDRDPGPGLAPETDPLTYNGSVWLLARRTYWVDPNTPPNPTSLEYQLALEFYRGRAVGPDFRWSWRNAALEQQVYRETIQKSDQAYRDAQVQLGLLLANHVVSAVDALISSRLEAVTRRPTHLRTTLGPHGRASVRLRVAF